MAAMVGTGRLAGTDKGYRLLHPATALRTAHFSRGLNGVSREGSTSSIFRKAQALPAFPQRPLSGLQTAPL